jgi:hypothetical protein
MTQTQRPQLSLLGPTDFLPAIGFARLRDVYQALTSYKPIGRWSYVTANTTLPGGLDEMTRWMSALSLALWPLRWRRERRRSLAHWPRMAILSERVADRVNDIWLE